MTATSVRSTGERSTTVWIRRGQLADVPWIVLALIVAGWLLAVAAQLNGQAGLLHHHELIEGGSLPLWLAAMAFLVGWQVMIAGMMLPASLPAVRAFALSRTAGLSRTTVTASERARDRGGPVLGFLAAYLLAWTAFGLVAFLGDVVVHRTVDVTPWLDERQWLIEMAVLVVAGAYQFLPWKRRGLAACRHPTGRVSGGGASGGGPGQDGFEAGFRHAADCLTSSWALMLLMFAAGFANLAWMAILAAVMAYEATGRHGQRVASAFGAVLLGLAVAVAWSGLAGSPALASLV